MRMTRDAAYAIPCGSLCLLFTTHKEYRTGDVSSLAYYKSDIKKPQITCFVKL